MTPQLPLAPSDPIAPPSSSHRSRNRSRLLLISALFGACLLVLGTFHVWNEKASGLPGAAGEAAVAPTLVELAPATAGRITEGVRAVGTLEANESVMIRPEIPGVVTRVFFTEGQGVEKGLVLLELDDSELKASLAEAHAQLAIARSTHDRMKQLMGNQNPFVSAQQIDQAISNLGAAEAKYALYQTRLAKTRIRAPFTGYLGIRRVSPGDYVQPGQDLVNLEDLRTLKIDFKVPETYLHRLAVGQRVDVTTDADPDAVVSGEIYVIDPRVDSNSRAVHLRARIPNSGGALRPGLFANVHLVLGEQPKALLIPEEAVIPQHEQYFVFRSIDGVARWTEVTLGVRERGLVQVLTGLREGDTVVRVGHHKLRDGMRVASAETP
ncbi:efflux RND transporter periplasmic adaptor subunit [Candidatus Nitrospira bockiana]